VLGLGCVQPVLKFSSMVVLHDTLQNCWFYAFSVWPTFCCDVN